MFEDVSRVFVAGLHQLGLAGDEAAELRCLTAFQLYRQELLQWNAHTNLTAITDPEEVLLKHFLNSLSLLQAYDQTTALRLLDIGTGAGFPGIPLKIVRPSWQVTLLEATGKKTVFLQHIIDTLHLEDITVIHGRAEEFAHKEDYRATFDIVTARAVAALPVLLESCSPYCRPGGRLILPKRATSPLNYTSRRPSPTASTSNSQPTYPSLCLALMIGAACSYGTSKSPAHPNTLAPGLL